MNLKRITTVSLFIFVFSLLQGEEKEDKTLLLKIGNKTLKDKTMEVTAGKIYSAHEGKSIPFVNMIKDMRKSRFIYIGESHNSLPMHDIQLEIINALYEQDKNLAIGLEMFSVGFQEVLNKWSMGILSQPEFIQESKWYINWNYNYGFYKGIFKLAKDKKIPLYAINVPKTIITKIRKKGWNALSEEEKKITPKPGLSHEGHRTLIRTIFESTELPPQMKGRGLEMAFEGLYRAQSAWDEAMAFHALRATEREGRKVVVLAGSGHLLYNLGINRRAYQRSPSPFKTVICLVVPEGKKGLRVTRSLADYVWGIAEEKMPAFPSVGLRFKKFDGLDNLVVENKPINGVAKNSNFLKGDVILSVDGMSFTDINDLRTYLAKFKWNDEVKFRLLRNASQLDVLLKFQLPEEKR